MGARMWFDSKIVILFVLSLCIAPIVFSACTEIKLNKDTEFFDFESGAKSSDTSIADLEFKKAGPKPRLNEKGQDLTNACEFDHDQPLCIADMGKNSFDSVTSPGDADYKEFPEARKDHTYVIITEKGGYGKIFVKEIAGDKSWIKFNYLYSSSSDLSGHCAGEEPVDSDGDGVADDSDNCVSDANPGQEDCDGDGTGDVCDSSSPCSTDSDGDTVLDDSDNCINDSNPGQEDCDGDGVGDVCDGDFPCEADLDGDGVTDAADNCPNDFNPGQEDADEDGIGDVCDPTPTPEPTPDETPLETPSATPSETPTDTPGEIDSDGDGYPDYLDCAPSDPLINAGADEVCNGVDDDCDLVIDEGCDEEADLDGDGFIAGVDCDDSNPIVWPGAAEYCDSTDNDCDGVVDEGCNMDADGDGYYSEDDCDDFDYFANPGATEKCNGKDDDCDGIIDEACVEEDADGDGYNSDVDCDDSDAAIRPFGNEVCGDGKDNDCDGRIDEGCGEDADADEDGYSIGTDCDDSNPLVNPGQREQCNGFDDDCDGSIDEGCQIALDSDSDGVFDSLDLCPWTQPGLQVDSFGCRIASSASVEEHLLSSGYIDGGWSEGNFEFGQGFVYSVVSFSNLSSLDVLKWEFVYSSGEEEKVVHEVMKTGFGGEDELFALLNLDPRSGQRHVPFNAASLSWRVDFFVNGKKEFTESFSILSTENDSDGDGVLDAVDKCVDSTKGTVISSTGCVLEEGQNLIEQGICSEVGIDSGCSEESQFVGVDGRISQRVVVSNLEKGDVLRWSFTNSAGTGFEPAYRTETIVLMDLDGESEWVNFIDFSGIPKNELFSENWSAEFFVNGQSVSKENFFIRPEYSSTSTPVQLKTAHGVYKNGGVWIESEKFTSMDEFLVALIDAPSQVVEFKDGKAVNYPVEVKDIRWRWVWPDKTVWGWRAGGLHEVISPKGRLNARQQLLSDPKRKERRFRKSLKL